MLGLYPCLPLLSKIDQRKGSLDSRNALWKQFMTKENKVSQLHLLDLMSDLIFKSLVRLNCTSFTLGKS